MADHPNFQKYAALIQEARAESDPAMREAMSNAAKRYLDLDVSAAKQQIKAARPGYGAARIIGVVIFSALLLIVALSILAHYVSSGIVLAVGGTTAAICFLAILAALRWTGDISESGFLDAAKSTVGLLGKTHEEGGPGRGMTLPGDKPNPELPEPPADA